MMRVPIDNKEAAADEGGMAEERGAGRREEGSARRTKVRVKERERGRRVL
jgi:hypothetical protein